MSLGPSIVCPVDFSEGSRAALLHAAVVADHFGARLIVMTVDDPLLTEAAAVAALEPSLAAQSEAELKRFTTDVLPHHPGAKTLEFHVATGKPATEILRMAQSRAADLIVMSSRGRSGVRKAFFGSTTERVLRETAIPVLITPNEPPATTSLSEMARRIHRILTPVDLTSASRRQVTIACGIAKALGVPVILTHVLEPIFVPVRVREALSGADSARRSQVDVRLAELEALVPAGVTVEHVVSTGDPADEIVHIAQTRGANLIVMGLHSGGFLGPRMGAVTYRVLSTTRALVVALPPAPHAD
jgi:nucleotide-binding universal stress UspA family protein